MTSRFSARIAAACGVLLAAAPIWAHHSFAAEYDSTKTVSVKGTVQVLKWVNPHAYVYVDVKSQVDAAALRLRDACRVALDTSFPDDELRKAIFAAAGGEDNLEFAIPIVGDLTRPPEDHFLSADTLSVNRKF